MGNLLFFFNTFYLYQFLYNSRIYLHNLNKILFKAIKPLAPYKNNHHCISFCSAQKGECLCLYLGKILNMELNFLPFLTGTHTDNPCILVLLLLLLFLETEREHACVHTHDWLGRRGVIGEGERES